MMWQRQKRLRTASVIVVRMACLAVVSVDSICAGPTSHHLRSYSRHYSSRIAHLRATPHRSNSNRVNLSLAGDGCKSADLFC